MATEGRPLIVGSDEGPEAPYPYQMEGKITTGFQRGSTLISECTYNAWRLSPHLTLTLTRTNNPPKLFSFYRNPETDDLQIGFPTANLPINLTRTPWINTIPTGVYFGWSSLRLPASHADNPFSSSSSSSAAPSSPYALYPMVMSIGYNPYFKNTVRTAEVHILHKFEETFYGEPLRLLILGYIRPEKDYPSLEALIEDIRFDTRVAAESLKRKKWAPKGVSVVGGWEEGELDVQWLVREEEDYDEPEAEGQGERKEGNDEKEAKI
ncbi:hypothetical protein jhhlp_003281 [Lomentospora prolificans]|uniref:Riboflavin kinase n=1 Tax=Lomentospora prolificans TaxID=41688 RepID=A0A2N3NGB6_9PEZI|nr:hypothetical protein jhhlp_003281 [Lomentospora prolificans]